MQRMHEKSLTENKIVAMYVDTPKLIILIFIFVEIIHLKTKHTFPLNPHHTKLYGDIALIMNYIK